RRRAVAADHKTHGPGGTQARARAAPPRTRPPSPLRSTVASRGSSRPALGLPLPVAARTMQMAADLFFFDADSLSRLPEADQDEFARGQPFPHAVFYDFLPDGVAARVLEEFPATDEIAWDVYRDRGNTEKLATTLPALIPSFTRHVLAEFNSAAIMEFLETLTGMTGLTPDPYFLGGGLHQIEPGGFLNVHADFN